MNSEIDVVVSWVDGSDPAVMYKKNEALRRGRNRGVFSLPSGGAPTRFADNNEIEYCVKSIRKFMPWVRKIFLVTDGQVPKFIVREGASKLGVTIVDHLDLFHGYEWALPTFNSCSIGTMLHRIPGLSERYIYFNDDIVVVKDALPSDFFVGDSVVLRGAWRKYRNLGIFGELVMAVLLRVLSGISKKERSAHLVPQMRAARMAGFRSCFFHCSHAPFPVVKATLEDYFLQNEGAIADNVKYQFRNLKQFVAHPLAHHLQLRSGSYRICDNEDNVTLTFSDCERLSCVLPDIFSSHVKFICLQSLELSDKKDRDLILGFLNRKIFS